MRACCNLICCRLLRANLLQPLTHIQTLSLRLDAVEELIANFEMLYSVTEKLGQLPRDLDRLFHSLALVPSLKGNISKR